MKRIIFFIMAVTFLGTMEGYAQKKKRTSRRQVDDTTQLATSTDRIVISPGETPGLNGSFDQKGTTYTYSLTPSGSERYNVAIQSFVAGPDFGNLRLLYNSYVSVEEPEEEGGAFKVRLHYANNSGYSWRQSSVSYLEATFDPAHEKVTYRAVGEMKNVLHRAFGRKTKEPLQSAVTREEAISQVIQHFVNYYRDNR